ncbi:Chromatin structure-remodeling complex subunit rsc7 [Penicillium diatomitis]|uniref:Chromatin structure-remodeling complex subunit rsc7 n=1 Tax=Penicillium diatomitis TaxID=2819901 RepID=A0A9W9WUT9_9EURO|nr:Chromatin structure-remodeling complex subunit rsc7 [Penicillium diatomitis]KAJ5477129.1 Chromatin structure-remodeling complex subunit rsc7 [Penicillium diatomitis]
MPRKLRAAAQAAAKQLKNVPTLPDLSDEEMVDALPSQPSSPPPEIPTSPNDDPDVEPENEDQDVDESRAETPDESNLEQSKTGSPAVGDATQIDESAETPSHAIGRPAIPRKRRLGRPPKNRPPDWDAPDGSQTPIRVTTPVKRRRGRPAASGGRWARNRGPVHNTQVPIDKEGNMMDVVGDEVALPPNPVGDTKVDENGHLLGGREYRVRTFTILNRGDKLYMLSTEPARCIGFRDSYLFFQRHKMLYKIIIDDEAKRDLIERDIIPHSYKGRAIGVVTARSVFREFGAKIVVGGKKVTDDYDEQAARERGDVEGELAVPEDKLPGPGETYNRNQYVAWHGASSVYHTNAPAMPLAGGKPLDPKKRRVPVTDENWMLEHARAASLFNSRLAEVRRETMTGTYDVHTNTMHYPKIMQPTHARWEYVPSSDAGSTAELMSTLSINAQNSAEMDTAVEKTNEQAPTETSFPPAPSHISNRYVVADTIYESPPYSNMGLPGPDGDLMNPSPNGLASIAQPKHSEFMTPEIIDLLPPDCKEAFIDAAAREIHWKSKWGSEAESKLRTQPSKSYAWYP